MTTKSKDQLALNIARNWIKHSGYGQISCQLQYFGRTGGYYQLLFLVSRPYLYFRHYILLSSRILSLSLNDLFHNKRTNTQKSLKHILTSYAIFLAAIHIPSSMRFIGYNCSMTSFSAANFYFHIPVSGCFMGLHLSMDWGQSRYSSIANLSTFRKYFKPTCWW